jgi:hypothetical protein
MGMTRVLVKHKIACKRRRKGGWRKPAVNARTFSAAHSGARRAMRGERPSFRRVWRILHASDTRCCVDFRLSPIPDDRQGPRFYAGIRSRLEQGGDDMSATSSLVRRHCGRAPGPRVSTWRVSDEGGAPEHLESTVAYLQNKKRGPPTLCFISPASLRIHQLLAPLPISPIIQLRDDTVLLHPRKHSKAKFRGDYCESRHAQSMRESSSWSRNTSGSSCCRVCSN